MPPTPSLIRSFTKTLSGISKKSSEAARLAHEEKVLKELDAIRMMSFVEPRDLTRVPRKDRKFAEHVDAFRRRANLPYIDPAKKSRILPAREDLPDVTSKRSLDRIFSRLRWGRDSRGRPLMDRWFPSLVGESQHVTDLDPELVNYVLVRAAAKRHGIPVHQVTKNHLPVVVEDPHRSNLFSWDSSIVEDIITNTARPVLNKQGFVDSPLPGIRSLRRRYGKALSSASMDETVVLNPFTSAGEVVHPYEKLWTLGHEAGHFANSADELALSTRLASSNLEDRFAAIRKMTSMPALTSGLKEHTLKQTVNKAESQIIRYLNRHLASEIKNDSFSWRLMEQMGLPLVDKTFAPSSVTDSPLHYQSQGEGLTEALARANNGVLRHNVRLIRGIGLLSAIGAGVGAVASSKNGETDAA